MMKFLAILIFTATTLFANPDTDWRQILALDAGPSAISKTQQEGRSMALAHLGKQRAALDAFVRQYPEDARAHNAYIRLAKVLAAEGSIAENPALSTKALEILRRLQTFTHASAAIRTDAAFYEAWISMQISQQGKSPDSAAVVAAVEKFATAYKSDPRTAHLLAEAASVCDSNPSLKRKLLTRAKAQTADPALQDRINDDLRRLDLLGKKISLSMPTLAGDAAALSNGKPTLVVFWSPKSPQSLLWIEDLRAEWNSIPNDKISVITVAVDADKRAAADRAKFFPAAWLTLFDAKGWESPAIRTLGINALPTVWHLAPDTTLRSINAKSSWKTLAK